MDTPTYSQVAAVGRHVLTAGATVVTTLAVLHVLSADDASKVNDAFSQIGSGIASLTAGITTLIGVGSGLYAAWTASPFSQIKSVAAMPNVAGVVTVPTVEGKALAESIPSPAVAAAGTAAAATIAAK